MGYRSSYHKYKYGSDQKTDRKLRHLILLNLDLPAVAFKKLIVDFMAVSYQLRKKHTKGKNNQSESK